jgi:phosphoglycerol geranylgeranyltransferase
MRIGKVEKLILDTIDREGGMLFPLLDPVDHKSPDAAASVAASCAEAGCELMLIGGSIGAQGELLDETARRVKEEAGLPVLLFPGNIATITKHADALYFMSMLNSRNPYWISMAQTTAAPVVKRMGIEAIPVGYVVVEPGGTVGWVGDANLVPRNRPAVAASLALAGQYMGSRMILTDAGSNPAQGPIPVEMVRAVADVIDVPYVVAGGVRTAEQAFERVKAGADAIQIGTAFESGDAKKRAEELVKAIKKAGREKK